MKVGIKYVSREEGLKLTFKMIQFCFEQKSTKFISLPVLLSFFSFVFERVVKSVFIKISFYPNATNQFNRSTFGVQD